MYKYIFSLRHFLFIGALLYLIITDPKSAQSSKIYRPSADKSAQDLVVDANQGGQLIEDEPRILAIWGMLRCATVSYLGIR